MNLIGPKAILESFGITIAKVLEKIIGRLDIIYVSKASFIGRIVGLYNVW
jgi:hypothetical protein